MDFRQLETFVEVINLKSFSKAAKKLFLTQPTITSHIQNLEKELGTILINRSSKEISPTDAGNILYDYALNIINMRDMAQFKLNKYQGKIQGELEISASSIPEQYVLPYILKDFINVYPDVTFTITHNDSKQVIESITEGYVDFGIVGAKFNSNSLEYIELLEDNLVIVTPNNENYPLESYGQLDTDFLLNENIILREAGSGSRLFFENILKNKNVDIHSLNIVAHIEDNETIKKFIELGLGISIMSEMAIKKEIELGMLKPYYINGFDFKRKFYFVYHKKRHLSPLAETFRDFVVKYIQKQSK